MVREKLCVLCFHSLAMFLMLYASPLFSITGMSELVKERPANPIEYLASYLIRHDPQRAGAPPSSMSQQMQQQQMAQNAPMHR
jgi:hypothetical protein